MREGAGETHLEAERRLIRELRATPKAGPEPLRPRCPLCGEPARHVVVTSEVMVRSVLRADGTPGRVLQEKRCVVGAIYVCGGDHKWGGDPPPKKE